MSLEQFERVEPEPVAEGSYGRVFKGKDNISGELVALKELRPCTVQDGFPASALREVSVLRELDHPNIVKLKAVHYGHRTVCLAVEWMDKDLYKYMYEAPEEMPINRVKSFLYQLLRAMDYCHGRGVMHRDLKPHNILVGRNGCIKVADFGLGRAFSLPLRAYSPEVVTLGYRAPEILLGQRVYSPAVDVWSVGVIFAEMANGRIMWPCDSQIDGLFRIFQTLGTPTEDVWPGVTSLPDFKESFPYWPRKPMHRVCPRLDANGQDLLEKLLVYDPVKRICAREAMAHPFFDKGSV